MYEHQLKDKKHCRWCATEYYAYQPWDRDGFCTKAHKQAHHRAWVRYVATHPGQQKRSSSYPKGR